MRQCATETEAYKTRIYSRLYNHYHVRPTSSYGYCWISCILPPCIASHWHWRPPAWSCCLAREAVKMAVDVAGC